jgi:hypothetical protein
MNDNWINVNERQPELADASVLVHFETGSIETVHIEDWFSPMLPDNKGWYTYANPKITHWQPLPAPPKQ